ncbi:MAG: autotransporter family protein, partial [Planctomycetota bacterium]
LEKTGAGKLALTGANAYTGGTTVTGGTLQGNATSLQGNVTNDAAVIFNQSGTTGTYAGVMSGTGTLEKIGSDKLVLDGANTYTGDTTVTAGTLEVNGSIDSVTTTVASGARIGGIGTIGGDLNNNWTIVPGDPDGTDTDVGTLRVSGDYEHAATARYFVEFDPTTSDKISVTGTANILGGSVTPIFVDPATSYETGTHTILQGASVVGTFDDFNIPSDTAVLSMSLDYLADRVNMLFTRNNYVTLAATPNQRSVAAALEDIRAGATGDLQTVLSVLENLQLGPFQAALDDISPASYDATSRASLNTARVFNGGVVGRMGQFHSRIKLQPKNSGIPLNQFPQWGFNSFDGNGNNYYPVPTSSLPKSFSQFRQGEFGVWVRQFNTWASEDGGSDQVGFDFDTYGAMIGGDFRIGSNFVLGGAIGYSQTDVTLDEDTGNSDIDTLHTMLYATYFEDDWYVDAALGFGYNCYDNTRNINFLGREATSEHDGQEYRAYLGGGYDFDINGWILGPIGSMQYLCLKEESFTEDDAGAMNLTIDAQDSQSLLSAVGVRFGRVIDLDSVTIMPEIRAEWLHEYLDDTRTITSRFATGGGSFSVDGKDPETDSAAIGARLNVGLSENAYIFLNYELLLQGGDGLTGNSLWGGIRIEF